MANIHAILLDPRIFLLQRQGEERSGWGVEVTGHAHSYVFILPAKRVFPFFGVKSFGDDSSLRRFTSGRGNCLVEPPA